MVRRRLRRGWKELLRMAFNKQLPPDDGIKDLIYIGDDGYFYYKDIPDNKIRLSKTNSKHIGYGTKIPKFRYKDEQYQAHRLMYWFITGKWPECVKQIDGNLSNYRFDNLREVSQKSLKVISPNSGLNIAKKIRPNGTYYYSSRLQIDGKGLHLGSFRDEQSALFMAWKVRDTLYPGQVPIPDKIKHIVAISKIQAVI